jgi:ATPase subunit of ABC transporter with duplicated ATPase domains
MPFVRLERVSFAHRDSVSILDEVDLHLAEGWSGLVGENGAGKTTLLRLIAGELAPDSGRVRIEPAGARVVLCPQVLEAAGPDVEDLAERGDGDARRLKALLHLDAESLSRWSTLSPGQRKRWQVGAALAREPDVLLLDEPTNHIDAEARAQMVGALRRFRGIGALVSHDRSLLEALAGRTVRLHRGRVEVLALPYSEARAAWEAQTRQAWERRSDAQEEARRAARKLADARREREAAERSMSGRHRDHRDREARSMGAKTLRGWAEARLGRDVRHQRASAERAKEEVPEVPEAAELGRAIFLGFARAPRPALLALEAPQLCAGPAVLLRDVKVQLRQSDRVRLEGANGAGKSTLLAALCASSTLPPERLLFLPQEVAPEDAAALLNEVRNLDREVRGQVLSLAAALGADPSRLLASEAPSPGEVRKLTLALGLGRHAWAVVLDEPTNHLDLPTIERLEAALATYPGAILLVTHDDAFAGRCTSAVWRIAAGRVETAQPSSRC